MNVRFRRLLSLPVLLALALPFGTPAVASDFPNRQVQVVVPYPPGAAVDIVARPEMRKQLVEARGLAIANIGMADAPAELNRRFQAGAEMVRVSGADRE